MAKQDFLPDGDPQFQGHHDNLNVQLPSVAPKYNVTAPQQTEVSTDNVKVHTDFGDAASKRAASQAATTKKRATRRSVEGHVRALARQIKAHPAYDPADGQLLGIVGPEDTTDLTNAKPTLVLRNVTPGIIELGFNKSVSDGVRIETRRAGETNWTFLAIDTESPYVDNRANLAAGPETREYRAQYLEGDDPIGLLSDILSVTAPAGVAPVNP